MNERRQDSGGDGRGSTGMVDHWLRSTSRGPALVIAAGEALLVAANADGARLLGLAGPPDQPVPLDSAMPAIMDLRRAVNRGARGTGPPIPLVFWTGQGIARLACHVEVVDGEGGRRLAFIEVTSEAAAKSPAEPLTTAPTATPAPPTSAQVPDETVVAPSGDWSGAGLPATGTSDVSGEPEQGSAQHEAQSPTEARASNPARMARAAPARAGGTPRRVRATHSAEPQTGTSTDAAPASTPVASALAASAPSSRSDEDTLKAIARQILAGRRAASKPPAGDARDAPERSAQPNGAAPHATAQPSMGGGSPRHRTGAGETAADRSDAEPASAAGAPAATDAGTPMPAAASEPPALRDARPSARAALPPGGTPGEDTTAGTGEDTLRSTSERRTRMRRMAHELKTPISAIASAAEIMKDERLGSIGDERYLRYAQDIYDSARHALAVIERMLGHPHKDATDSELSFTNVDLNSLAARLLSGLEAMAGDAGLKLNSDLAPRLPLVVADATSLRQIVLNLLTNAVKFTPRGGRVLLATRLAANGELELSVSDTGPGISEEEIAQITGDTPSDAAHTASARKRRPGGGLGIGLPLARALAAANGATLMISAQASGGTQATLSFPVSRQVPI